MGRAGNINLITTTIETAPEFAGYFKILQKVSYTSLIVLIVSGVIVGSIFAYVSSRQSALRTEKNTLLAQINRQSVTEGLLLAVKQRVAVIDKILAGKQGVEPLFAIVDGVAAVGKPVSLLLDEFKTVTIVVHVGSVGEAITVADGILEKAKTNVITKPALASFTVNKEGGFDMGISFVVQL